VNRTGIVFLVLVACVAGTVALADELYVDGGVGVDNDACGAPGSPCDTVQYAIANRAADGDSVRIIQGNYAECIDTLGKKITVVSDEYERNGTNAGTVLDGTLCVGTGGSSVPTVLLDDGATLQGLTIRGGNDSGVKAFGTVAITNNLITANEGSSGGGVYANGSVTIADNVISGNSADYGAGVYVFATDYFGDTEDVVIADNQIRDNAAVSDGGGAYLFSLGDTGTSPKVRFEDNLVETNEAFGFGGGLVAFSVSSPTASTAIVITRNEILQNAVTGDVSSEAVGYGGGVWAGATGEGGESIEISENVVDRNTSTVSGAGVAAWVRGPGEFAASRHDVVVANNDITNNESDFDGGGMDLYLEALSLADGATMALRVEDNLLEGNIAGPDGLGGAGFVWLISERTLAGQLDLAFERNEFRSNLGGLGAGALSVWALTDANPVTTSLPGASRAEGRIRFENVLFADNATDPGGVGAAVLAYLDSNGDAQSTIEMSNVTIVGNTAASSAIEVESYTTVDSGGVDEGSGLLEIENSILASNEGFAIGGPTPGAAGVLAPDDGTGNFDIEVRYSNLFGNDGVLEGTIAGLTTVANPVVGDPLLDADYIPGRCSPTLDAGDPASDFSLEPAPNGGRINLGNLGGSSLAVASLADVNGDRTVNGLDVLAVAAGFTSIPGQPKYLASADFDSSDLIDGDDLSFVSADFIIGATCP